MFLQLDFSSAELVDKLPDVANAEKDRDGSDDGHSPEQLGSIGKQAVSAHDVDFSSFTVDNNSSFVGNVITLMKDTGLPLDIFIQSLVSIAKHYFVVFITNLIAMHVCYNHAINTIIILFESKEN